MSENETETLHSALISIGYTSRDAKNYGGRDLFDGSARYVGEFTASQAWELVRGVRTAAKAATPEQRISSKHSAIATAGPFQMGVYSWAVSAFGIEGATDKDERNHRFLEEALELVQALGCTASEAHQLVEYVFNRPVGEPFQEAGGTMTTLALLCHANGIDMDLAGAKEQARIWGKIGEIRRKQAAKPKHSPLPGPSEPDRLTYLTSELLGTIEEYRAMPEKSLRARMFAAADELARARS